MLSHMDLFHLEPMASYSTPLLREEAFLPPTAYFPLVAKEVPENNFNRKPEHAELANWTYEKWACQDLFVAQLTQFSGLSFCRDGTNSAPRWRLAFFQLRKIRCWPVSWLSTQFCTQALSLWSDSRRLRTRWHPRAVQLKAQKHARK